MMAAASWLQRWGKRSGVRARVYGVPHAGAGAADLRSLAATAPEWLEVVAVRLPGRERRIQEPLPTQLSAVVSGIREAVLADAVDGVPFLLFGQCAGSLLSFEAAWQLSASGGGGLVGLALSAPPNPDQDFTGAAELASQPDFAQRMLALGAVPAAVAAEPAMLEVLLPVLRADYALFEGYECPGDRGVEVPILAVAGSRDELVPLTALAPWGRRTRRGLLTRELEGGHLLAAEAPAALMRELEAFAASLL